MEDRIYKTSKKQAFITLKDHKPNFINKPTCRLLNPTKSEIGKISKQKLAKIVKVVNEKKKFNLWRNTQSVITWFESIQNKNRASFIQFDVCDFYPSITEELLNKALDLASKYTNVSEEDRKIISQARKSFLFDKEIPWSKRKNSEFDVGMGCFDGAEVCELVGIYMLSRLQHLKVSLGLYRDDGLGVSHLTARQTELVKKEICRIFKEENLSITIEVNKKVTDFLDVTFDLSSSLFKPFMKPNDSPLYISKNSNHPPSILKNIPEAVNKRLSSISANEAVFNNAAPPYQAALQKAGHAFDLKYLPPNNTPTAKKKNRGRKITWFNPPYSSNVSTNIGAKFLKIIDQCFPTNHPLAKIFNRNTIKISYRCMPNMSQTLSKHNSKVNRNLTQGPPLGCNCQGGLAKCPVGGACQTVGVVYQTTVETAGSVETYTGLTSRRFKDRLYEHHSDMNNEDREGTGLSHYIWRLKHSNRDYNITWKLIARAPAFNPSTKSCNLCLKEKYFIMFRPEGASLNSRSELFATCRHRLKPLLGNS